jgi:S1-C subfamily serine protease
MKFKIFLITALILGISLARRPSLPEREQAETVLVETPRGWGSAVTVKRGGMVFAWTAAHVVDEFAAIKVHKVLRFRGRKAGDTICNAHVIKYLPKVDAALLVIDGDPKYFSDATFAGIIPPPPGSLISHVGNVLGDSFDTSYLKGVVSQLGIRVSQEDCLLDQANLTVAPGCSGGPVFNSQGNVIGLAVIYVGPGVALYVPNRELAVAAEKEKIDWALHGFVHPPVREISEFILAREKEIAKKKPDPEILSLLFGVVPPEKK